MAYDADPASYRVGTVKFDIASTIYGTNVVKRQLKTDQHDKCAFCEAIFDANVAGDVEHYRPKGAVETGSGKLHPGYYWLGYTWSNLSYACPDCNEYRKRDRFPLANEAPRARCHHDSVAAETPLLLDPYGAQDPRDHIKFFGEAPVGRTPSGANTIEILGLNRISLARDRLLHLTNLTLLYDALQALRSRVDPDQNIVSVIDRLEAELAAAVRPEAKFSAASIDHLAAMANGESYLPVPK